MAQAIGPRTTEMAKLARAIQDVFRASEEITRRLDKAVDNLANAFDDLHPGAADLVDVFEQLEQGGAQTDEVGPPPYTSDQHAICYRAFAILAAMHDGVGDDADSESGGWVVSEIEATAIRAVEEINGNFQAGNDLEPESRDTLPLLYAIVALADKFLQGSGGISVLENKAAIWSFMGDLILRGKHTCCLDEE